MSSHADFNRLIKEYRALVHKLTEAVYELRDVLEQSMPLFEANAQEFVAERPEKISIH